MSMELTIKSFDPSTVVWNRAELEAEIAAVTARYADGIPADKATAKRDRAELNRLRKGLDEARKEVKRRYEAPYKAFEAELKAMIAPLDALAARMDEAAKAFEAEERAARLEALKDAWATRKWSVPFDRILTPEMLKAGTSEKRAIELMFSAAAMAENDRRAIIGLGGNYEHLLEMYENGASLSDVLMANAAQVKPTSTDGVNTYTVTPQGVLVQAAKQTYTITVTCSEMKFGEICRAMDSLGVFYAVDRG